MKHNNTRPEYRITNPTVINELMDAWWQSKNAEDPFTKSDADTYLFHAFNDRGTNIVIRFSATKETRPIINTYLRPSEAAKIGDVFYLSKEDDATYQLTHTGYITRKMDEERG